MVYPRIDLVFKGDIYIYIYEYFIYDSPYLPYERCRTDRYRQNNNDS